MCVGITCVDFVKGCRDAAVEPSAGPPGLHSQSDRSRSPRPWTSQHKAGFSSEKRRCENGTFLLSRSGRRALSEPHLLTAVTKISFYGFPALWALQNHEGWGSRSWMLRLLVGLFSTNRSQQRGCSGISWPCTVFLLVPAAKNLGEERNPGWFYWFKVSGWLQMAFIRFVVRGKRNLVICGIITFEIIHLP